MIHSITWYSEGESRPQGRTEKNIAFTSRKWRGVVYEYLSATLEKPTSTAVAR